MGALYFSGILIRFLKYFPIPTTSPPLPPPSLPPSPVRDIAFVAKRRIYGVIKTNFKMPQQRKSESTACIGTWGLVELYNLIYPLFSAFLSFTHSHEA